MLKLFTTKPININIDEADTLKAFQQGSEQAFSRLYELYYAPLINFARKKTDNIQVAEDMVQEVFIYLYTHRPKIESNIKGYLFTALTRDIYNYWRQEMVRKNYKSKLEYRGEALEKDASTILELKELQVDFEEQIIALPAQCQTIFRLRKEHHLSNKDIAEQLGISVKAVEAQITKAIKILRGHFEYYSFAGLLLAIYEAIG